MILPVLLHTYALDNLSLNKQNKRKVLAVLSLQENTNYMYCTYKDINWRKNDDYSNPFPIFFSRGYDIFDLGLVLLSNPT